MTGANATLTGAEPRCLECGYLLIGLPQERCPECGTAFTWAEVIAAAGRRGLPIEEGRGWRRLTGALLTWLLVLFRPIVFARRVDRHKSLGLATLFAMACVAVGVIVWWQVMPVFPFDLSLAVGWTIGVFVHVELQALLFTLVDLRWFDWRQHWRMWRKVSLYTTAFVALECLSGPPMLFGFADVNFPWLYNGSCISEVAIELVLYECVSGRWMDLVLGLVYHWWMAVLLAVVAVRMKRKWGLLVVLAALPCVSVLSSWAGWGAGWLALFVAGVFGA